MMVLDPNRKSELDAAWMESLLVEIHQSDAAEEKARLNKLFATLDDPSVDVPLRTNDSTSRVSTMMRRVAPLALAASLLVVVSVWWLFSSSSQSAYAAVVRSMKPAPMTRLYVIHAQATGIGGNVKQREVKLFLDSQDRYAVNHTGWFGGEVWFGDNGKQKWFVPRLGPAVSGGEWITSKWMTKKDATSPYLHLNTILQRMANGYQLTRLPSEQLASHDGTLVDCDHVRGLLKPNSKRAANSGIPDSIELWADRESGMAYKVLLTWQRDASQAGPTEWSIELAGHPKLGDDFFEPRGHLRAGQRIVQVGSEAEMEKTVPE
jgi:hypothetical protein